MFSALLFETLRIVLAVEGRLVKQYSRKELDNESSCGKMQNIFVLFVEEIM